MGAVPPALKSMRRILLLLPEEVFDNTTEGMFEKNKALLANDGVSDIFDGGEARYELSEEGVDYLSVRYPKGQIIMLRFPGQDGSAVIAAATDNMRANTFELWRFPPDGSAPELLPLDQAFARPEGGTPSPYPDPMSPEVESVYYSLNPESAEIQIQ